MIYDLRADRDSDAYRNAMRVRLDGVSIDGQVVRDVFFADTEAGIVRSFVRRSGRLVMDGADPLEREQRGHVEVEERTTIVRTPRVPAYVPPPVLPLAPRFRPFDLE